MTKVLLNIILLISFLVLVGCNSNKEKDEGTSGTGGNPSNPIGLPKVSSIGGSSVLTKATLSPIIIQSNVILDELDNLVANGYSFVISADDTQVPNQPILLSVDGQNYSESVTVTSLDARIQFYAKVPTKVGFYRISARANHGIATGRFYVTVDSSDVASIGVIRGSTYQDKPPYNGVKDLDENWSLLGDGQASTYIKVGPIIDAFGNKVSQATVGVTLSRGTLISENPTGISDGEGIFRVESDVGTGIMGITAYALDQNNNVLALTTGSLEQVAPLLSFTVLGDTNFGNMFINESKTVSFLITNNGTSSATNLMKLVDNPYQIVQTSSCVLRSTLRPGESCEMHVRFDAGIRGNYTGLMRFYGSPTSVLTNRIEYPLSATVVVPPIIGINDVSFSILNQSCGTSKIYETYIHNTGDLDALNLTASPVRKSNGTIRPDVEVIIPPADMFPDTDMNQIINCGNRLPAGRKCRIQVRFHPTSLQTDEPLTSVLSVDDVNPITLTVRASSVRGKPAGTIPVQILNPANFQPISSLDIGETNSVIARVGPVADLCGNPIHNIPVYASAYTAGNVTINPVNTNSGMADIVWYGSSQLQDIGVQTITVVTRDTDSTVLSSGTGQIRIEGIKLATRPLFTGTVGQILTVNYNPAKYYDYEVKNEGTQRALNMVFRMEPSAASQWFQFQNNFQGGCQDYILEPGETCTVRFKADTTVFGEGVLNAHMRVETTGVGLIETQTLVSGLSVNPPTMSFIGGPTIDFGAHMAGTNPTKIITLKNNSGLATVNNLLLKVNLPFSQISTTCSTSLSPLGECDVVVGISQNIKGQYSQSAGLLATGEWGSSSASVNLQTQIIPNLASGTIPVSFNKTSVPANNSDIITVTVGPIVDSYGNKVPQGTIVNIATNKGLLSIDNDLDGIATLPTLGGSNEGMASFTIQTKNINEIGSFTISADIKNTQGTVVASGSRSGLFTGALLEFNGADVDFGSVALLSTETRRVTLRNNGNEPATNIVWSRSSNDFIIVGNGNTCQTLAAGASCEVDIAVYPIQQGNLSGVISVNGNGNGIVSDSLSLTAVAMNAAKIVIGNNYNSSTVNYDQKIVTLEHKPRTNPSATFRIRNVGQEALIDMTYSVNNRSSEFVVTLPTACKTLSSNAECTATVSFNEGAVVPDSFVGNITITAESASKVTSDTISYRVNSPNLIFVVKSSSAQINTCTAFQVALMDNDSNLVTTTVNLPLVISKTAGLNGSFFSNASCSTALGSISITNGQSTSPLFYFRGTESGNNTIAAGITPSKNAQNTISIFDMPQLNPSNRRVATGDEIQFQTLGGITPITYTTTATGGATIDSTGLFTAGSNTGTFTVRATDNMGNYAEESVIITGKFLTAGKYYWCSTGGDGVKCIGENASGQYGVLAQQHKGNFDESIPVAKYQTFTPNLGTNRTLVKMYAGTHHSCYVNDNNQLYCQGNNNFGQIGNGTQLDRIGVPTLVSGLVISSSATKPVSLSHGHHTCAINNSQKVVCWGRNDAGQVTGIASDNPVLVPTQISTGVFSTLNFSQVVTGASHTCALASNNQIYCIGNDTYGQLGNGSSTNLFVSGILAGTSALTTVREISSGKYHTCATNTANQLYCWGRNSDGQLGNNTNTNLLFATSIAVTGNSKNVYTGGSHTCVVNNSANQLYCWGRNIEGQLGLGGIDNKLVPNSVGVVNPTEVVMGDRFTCYLTSGLIRCMGEGIYGQMGNNNLAQSNVSYNPRANGVLSCPSNMVTASGIGCRCSGTSYIMAYENKNCSSDSSVLEKIFPATNGPFYGLTNQITLLDFNVKTNASVFSNTVLRYSTDGNGLLNIPKKINDTDYPLSQNVIFTKQTDDTDNVIVRIGSSNSAAHRIGIEYRHYQNTCQDYQDLYPLDFSSGGGVLNTMNQAGTAVQSSWCRFVTPSVAYTYLNNTDYLNQELRVLINDGGNASSLYNCPYRTDVAWKTGEYYSLNNVENIKFFTELDLSLNSFIINQNLNNETMEIIQPNRQATIRWNCQ